jgi:hypothetical protein
MIKRSGRQTHGLLDLGCGDGGSSRHQGADCAKHVGVRDAAVSYVLSPDSIWNRAAKSYIRVYPNHVAPL